MSSLSEPWSILPFANRERGPKKLLFKFIINSDGFELYVTDLIRCWKASDTRGSATKRAVEDHCSIDPSEDASQFAVLLSKLMDGLSGQNGGRCKVGPAHRDASAGDSQGDFSLLSRTPLPAPLKSLHWTFHLCQEGPMMLARELLLPALAADLKNERQIDELTNKIKEKDHVISRLMDKIEQSSMDLSLVFPGYSTGRKGLNAQQALKVVPGASRFDEDGWRMKNREPMMTTTRSASDLLRKPYLDQVSFDSPHDYSDGGSTWEQFGNTGTFSSNWVDPLGDDPTFTEDEVSERGEKSKAGHNDRRRTPDLPTEESIDAFERPPTVEAELPQKSEERSHQPRHRTRSFQKGDSPDSDNIPPPSMAFELPKAGGFGDSRLNIGAISKSIAPKRRNSTTTSDSDSDSPPPAKTPKKSTKLGTLGGSKKPPQLAASRQSCSQSPVPSKPSTPSRKLGALGGKKDHTPPPSSPVPHHLQNEPSTSQHVPPRKLGVLGGRHKSATPQKGTSASKDKSQHRNRNGNGNSDPTDSPSPLPSPSRKEDPAKQALAEPEEEPVTAEEIADRKREELKRMLGAGGGKRKKRRF